MNATNTRSLRRLIALTYFYTCKSKYTGNLNVTEHSNKSPCLDRKSLSDQLLESLNVAGAFSQMYENVISYLQSIFFDFHIKTILAKYENQSIL